MATAADYLILSTKQIVTDYKLRTRSVKTETFMATNSSTDQILTVTTTDSPTGITVVPSQVILEPKQSATFTITYDTNYLETLGAGNTTNMVNLLVTAKAIVTLPPLQPTTEIRITPAISNLSADAKTQKYTATLYVNGQSTAAIFNWAVDNSAFSIDNTGLVTLNAAAEGNYSTTVTARVSSPSTYLNTQPATATANGSIVKITSTTTDVAVTISPVNPAYSTALSAEKRTQQYYAILKVNNTIVQGAEFDWSVDNNTAFSIDNTGTVTFNKSDAGTYQTTIRAIPRLYPNTVGTTSVTGTIASVGGGQTAQVVITPSSNSFTSSGQQRTYTATLYVNGSPSAADFTWNISGTGFSLVADNNTATATLIATNSGQYTGNITANVATRPNILNPSTVVTPGSATATGTIAASAKLYFIKFVDTPGIAYGTPFTISAMTYENGIPDTPVNVGNIDISMSPAIGVTPGPASQSGGVASRSFTINAEGTYTVTVSAPNAGSNQITFAVQKPVATTPDYRILITGPSTLNAGSSATIGATVYDNATNLATGYSVDFSFAGSGTGEVIDNNKAVVQATVGATGLITVNAFATIDGKSISAAKAITVTGTTTTTCTATYQPNTFVCVGNSIYGSYQKSDCSTEMRMYLDCDTDICTDSSTQGNAYCKQGVASILYCAGSDNTCNPYYNAIVCPTGTVPCTPSSVSTGGSTGTGISTGGGTGFGGNDTGFGTGGSGDGADTQFVI